jgi:L-lactate dehydrogenase complex protein LldG
MNERENIFGRIREALRVEAPMPGHPSPKTPAHPPGDASQTPLAGLDIGATSARQWLPFVGPSFDEQLALFRKNAADLKAAFHLLENRQELGSRLRELRDSEGWKKVGVHSGELTDFACAELGVPVCRTDSGYQAGDLENCNAGITQCDALVAQTGSVLLTSASAGGRALSVLPPHHVVLARREQLIADLPESFALLKQKYSSNYPSFISLITGPSRTGDIERILVLGAHGPRKLTIFCL